MFREGQEDVRKTLPDVVPGSLKATVYGAVQSLGLSSAALISGVAMGSTIPLIALASFSGAQEHGRSGRAGVDRGDAGAIGTGSRGWGEGFRSMRT
jgi:hypothetical protein